MFFIAVIWLLNYAISWWNCYAVGSAWVEAKHAGGWPRLLAWSGAVMAASGFSWCYVILLVIGAGFVDPELFPPERVRQGLSLGYVLLVPGILLSGLVITVQSWADAYRNRDWRSVGRAGWNTFAQSYNTYHAVTGFGDALKEAGGLFRGGGSKDKNAGAVILVLLVIVAICAGVIQTYALIHKYAARAPLPEFAK